MQCDQDLTNGAASQSAHFLNEFAIIKSGMWSTQMVSHSQCVQMLLIKMKPLSASALLTGIGLSFLALGTVAGVRTMFSSTLFHHDCDQQLF